MEKANDTLLIDECGCRLDRPVFLYIGKAVMVQNRMQHYVSCRRLRTLPPWVEEYTDTPHDHFLQAAVWYLEKKELAQAEATLIDLLEPLKNVNDRSGFGGNWTVREPDLFVINEDLEPFSKDPERVRVKNVPGVYAWFVDPGEQIYGCGQTSVLAESLLPHSQNPESTKRFIAQSKAIRDGRRLWSVEKGLFSFDPKPSAS